jgi:putative membrane protein
MVFAAVGPGQLLVAPLAFLAYAALYASRARTLARQGRPVPGWRQASFAGGIVLLLIAASPPFDHAADSEFSAHMAEHLLLGDLAPLLIVLGCSGPVLQPLLKRRVVAALRPITHPVVAFGLWAANLYLWHLAIAYQAALRHDAIHVLEHICFFAFGALLWAPLFGPLPKPEWFNNAARLGYILIVRFTGTVLANVFVWADTIFYPYYGRSGALSDQGTAGAVMMIEQSIVTICLFGWLFLKTAQDGEERQQLKELAAARGVPIDEQRIARAVAAGEGERLRRRIAASGQAADRTIRHSAPRA